MLLPLLMPFLRCKFLQRPFDVVDRRDVGQCLVCGRLLYCLPVSFPDSLDRISEVPSRMRLIRVLR